MKIKNCMEEIYIESSRIEQMVMKNTERFSNRVENYIRYRPHYPKEVIALLKKNIGLDSLATVADIGSGTGISSELFLQNGNKVYGVEPNAQMRQAAVAIFANNKNFISVDASAEATSLPDHSIDLILAGQAFHWFDKELAKKEFQRIAQPDAYLVLMWNDRKLDSEFQQVYELLLKEFAKDYEEVNYRNMDEKTIQAFFYPNPCALYTFDHSQFFDFESLKGRLLSSSYAPLESDANYQPMMQRLREIFDAYKVDSKIEFKYSCSLYYGKI